MKHIFTKKFVISIIISLTIGFWGCTANQTSAKKFTIAVVPKGTTHPFWKSVNAGALKAASDYKAQGVAVDLIWKGPLREDDREQQIQAVEGFVSQGVNGIVLAPLDSKALIRPVEEAKKAGIPTAIIDSALESDQITSFAATDNKKGGNLAAERLGELLGGKGKVIMQSHPYKEPNKTNTSTPSQTQRNCFFRFVIERSSVQIRRAAPA